MGEAHLCQILLRAHAHLAAEEAAEPAGAHVTALGILGQMEGFVELGMEDAHRLLYLAGAWNRDAGLHRDLPRYIAEKLLEQGVCHIVVMESFELQLLDDAVEKPAIGIPCRDRENPLTI